MQAVRNPRWQAVFFLALVAIVLTALLGGFRQAAPKVVPTYAAGARVSSKALAVQPLQAWLSSRNPQGYADANTHEDFLVLEANVENLTRLSNNWYLGSDLRWLTNKDDQTGTKPSIIYLADDNSLFESLQPHLPTRVLLTWKIPPGHAVSEPMRWGLLGRKFVEKTFLTTESGWLPDGAVATLKLPVTDRRAPAAAAQ
jgi:hypothetical protein